MSPLEIILRLTRENRETKIAIWWVSVVERRLICRCGTLVLNEWTIMEQFNWILTCSNSSDSLEQSFIAVVAFLRARTVELICGTINTDFFILQRRLLTPIVCFYVEIVRSSLYNNSQLRAIGTVRTASLRIVYDAVKFFCWFGFGLSWHNGQVYRLSWGEKGRDLFWMKSERQGTW